MAGLDWARTRPQAAETPSVLDRLPKVDWEFVFTVALCLGAATAISSALENGGWSRDMPPLTTVVIAGVLASAGLARTRLGMFLAWPLGAGLGAAVVFWQTLVLVGPGSLETRINAIYTRFDAWFTVAFGSGVTNDQLPFNVLVLALTWLGVFLFGWSVVRWHNAWIGLIPGGAVIFLDLVLVGDDLTGTILLYMLLGFLLVMQTNLNNNLRRWRQEGVDYPSFINVTFFHFSLWALIAIVAMAWIAPVGPFATPAPVRAAIDRTVETGADLVRLAGPLRSNKVIPIHSYSNTLTFDGSISLGDRELMAVTVTDPRIRGSLLLRGTVYDDYESGGWQTGDRRQVSVPDGATDPLAERVSELPQEDNGLVVPLHIELLAKSVVGTVIFTPGSPVDFDRDLTILVPHGAVSTKPASELANASNSDADIFALTLDEGELGVGVSRNTFNVPQSVQYIDLNAVGLSEAVEVDPGDRVKRHRSYEVTAYVPGLTADDLRGAEGGFTPFWVERTYTALTATVTQRVRDEAARVAGSEETRYDRAKAIENYLRTGYPVDYNIPSTPPGQDTVDHFLFESRRGYFNYHASAMVVMLRAVDVPARLAVGFAADEDDYDPAEGSYIVRDDNSYSWAEVYFPDYGWVPFNPSPDRPAVIEPRELDPTNPADLAELSGALPRGLPISAQEGFFVPPDADSIPLFDGDGSTVAAPAGGGSGYQSWILIAALGVAGAVVVAASAGWNRSVSGLPHAQQIWKKTVRLASWGGFRPEPGQTPHEFAAALGRRHRGVRDLDVLASAYTKSRFGKKDVDGPERERLNEMWPGLRGALMGGIARRITRRGKKVSD